MKITMICDAAGAGNNGVTASAKSLIRALKERGHEVVVVCSDEDKKGREGYVVLPRLGSGAVSGYFRANGVELSQADSSLLEPVIWDSDVVHIMYPFALGSAAMKLCRRHMIPVTADFCVQTDERRSRGLEKENRFLNSVTYRVLYQRFYRYADAVRYPSEYLRSVFEKAVGHPTDGFVIPRGVSGMFRPNGAQKPPELSGRFVILCVGGYGRGMGQSVLIDAAVQSQYSAKIQLILAGEGPMKRALKERASMLANKPLFGIYPYSQLPTLMNYADLYVHPAQTDSEAAVCMQALACGQVPVIANSPHNAARRFALDEHNLFDPCDPGDLAKKIDWFIEHPDKLASYRECYKGIVGTFREDVCTERFEDMLFAVHS